MIKFYTYFSQLSVFYFVTVNCIYTYLSLLTLMNIFRYRKKRHLKDLLGSQVSSFLPAVSVISSAYNEEKNICQSVKSFLEIDYPNFEVIIVNDGSRDATLEVLIREFHLRKSYESDSHTLYTNKKFGPLTVVDKKNTGKASSLNFALNLSHFDYVCCVDSDTLVEKEALRNVIQPFLRESDRVIACGGVIRISNRNHFLSHFQMIEYTRAFICGRLGWNALNATLVISGAFGVFKKDLLLKAGGYKDSSLGEDMELIVRLHKLQNYKIDSKIVFLPCTTCWTEVPSDVKTLYRQRKRWQQGLAEVLREHRSLLFNPKFKWVGILAMPYLLIFELFGPFFELLSYVLMTLAYFNSWVSPQRMFLFLMVSVVYGSLLSITSLMMDFLINPRGFHRVDFLRLSFYSLFENIGWRQFTLLARIHGIYSFLRGESKWGDMKREGIAVRS